jgi:Fe-S-cluster containining protein
MSEDPPSDRLVAAWREALRDPSVPAALAEIHARIAEEVRQRRPLCLASGRCCAFERFGHRLFVTGLEAVWTMDAVVARIGGAPDVAAVDAALVRGDCPFLVGGRLCGAHLERPLGCRIYFCDRAQGGAGAGWQEELSEALHRALVALHERHAIPYRYGEWRAMLRTVAAVDGR